MHKSLDAAKLDYASVYRAWCNQPKLNGILGELSIRFYIAGHFEPDYNAELKQLFFSKYPRRKIYRPEMLTEDEIAPIKEKWQRIALAVVERKIFQEAILDSLLYHLADNADMTPTSEMKRIDSSSSGSYASQGFGCNRYAKSALEPALALLTQAGFQAEIRQTGGQTTDRWGITYYDYELWANAHPWQLDALKRQGKMTPLNWAVQCWKNGTNPKVFNPFLDDAIYEESMAIHMGRDQ